MGATTPQKLLMTGSTFALTWGMVQHGGEGAIVAAVLASLVLSNADKIIGKFAGETSPQPIDDDYPTEEEIAAYRLMQRRGTDSPLPTNEEVEQELQRMLSGDSATDLALPPSALTGRRFDLSEVLATGFRPTPEKIYIGTLGDGTHVFCPVEALCHVALAGATDAGKSSIMRMLLAQLCYIKAVVLLLNPHYSGYLLDKQEDWTPFTPYLAYDPMKGREYPVIEHFLKQTAEVLIPKRLDLFAHSKPVGRPHFIVLDELPAIVKRNKKTPEYLDTILKEGRKTNVYLISAAQDYLVDTIGGTGAVRDCYRTAYYVGGDDRTAKVLLDMVPSQDGLGRGVAYLRNATAPAVKKAQLTYVPFTDNEALYTLLGPTTYVPDNTADTRGVDLMQGNQDNAGDAERKTEDLPAATMSGPAVTTSEQAPTNPGVYLGKDSSTGRDVTITQEEYRMAVYMRKNNMVKGHRDLMPAFSLSEHHARALNTLIRKELGLDAKGEREREAEKEGGREGGGEGE